MPNSIRNILKSLVYKGYMTQEQMDKIVRNLKGETVYCKECVKNGTALCPMLFTEMKPKDYCSYGEKKI